MKAIKVKNFIRSQEKLIAIDETAVKAKGENYYVYAAIDVDRNELIAMRIYSSRNLLTTKLFIAEVLKYCENKPKFIIDGAPWLINAMKGLGLSYKCRAFGIRSNS